MNHSPNPTTSTPKTMLRRALKASKATESEKVNVFGGFGTGDKRDSTLKNCTGLIESDFDAGKDKQDIQWENRAFLISFVNG